MTLTDFDPPRRLMPGSARPLALVRATQARLGEDRLAAALNQAGMDARPVSADDVCRSPRRFAGLLVWSDTAFAATQWLARLRAMPEGVLLPVMVGVRERTCALVDSEWVAYADAVVDDRSSPSEIAAGLLRLRRIAEVHGTLGRVADVLPPVQRQLAIVQFLVSREIGRLDPRRAASRPLGHSYAPLDLLGGAVRDDLDALVGLGLLLRAFFERLHVCPSCGDARLAFREVCAGCRSADTRHGEVVHHYACGHVAPEERFWRQAGLVCPSCGAALRHVGIDYERPASLLFCNACGLSGGEGITSARCLGCGADCTADEAATEVLPSYQLTPEGLVAARSGAIAP
jgi:hypothetical protein